MQLSSLIQYPQKIFKPECTSHSLFLVFVLFWSILILSSFSGSGNENRQRAASNENNSHEKIYLHAEIEALVKLRDWGRAYRIVVERYAKNGKPALAKPCPIC